MQEHHDARIAAPTRGVGVVREYMAAPGIVVWEEDPFSLNLQDEVGVYLAYGQRSEALEAVGRAIDEAEITLDAAQAFVTRIAPGHRINEIARDFAPRWWQRRGWQAKMRRFACAAALT